MAVKPQFIKSKMGGSSFTWKYPIPAVPKIAVYTFDATSDVMPTFNAEFTNYTVKDVDNGDGTITRTISSHELPTKINFRDKSTLLSVEYINTSNITNMSQMFFYCSSLTSINTTDWDTSKIKSTGEMFCYCTKLAELDLSSFDTSNITNMSYMFYGCTSLTSLNVSNWDTSKVTNMNGIFQYCSKLTSLNISNWDTGNVTKMSNMFSDCISLTSLDLSNFNTSKVTTMSKMFYSCKSLTSLNLNTTSWNTSNVTDMYQMFRDCSKLTSLNLSNFNTSKVTDMYCMFYGCSSLTSLDLSNFNTSNVTDMDSMFYGCNSLNWHYDGTNYANFTLTETQTKYSGTFPWNYPVVARYTFNNAEDTLPEFNSSFSYYTFNRVNNDNTITRTISKNIGAASPSSISFSGLGYLVSIDYLDTSNVTSMQYMFSGSSVVSINCTGWDTSKVTNISDMFNCCTSLTTLTGISTWNTSKVTTAESPFFYCPNLIEIDLSGWNTSKVTNMLGFFSSCSSLSSIILPDYFVTKTSNIRAMFSGCSALTSINLCGWVLPAGDVNFSYIFEDCSSLGYVEASYMTESDVEEIISQLPDRTSTSSGTITNTAIMSSSTASSKNWIVDYRHLHSGGSN